MKPARRPAKDVAPPATPEAIRKAANLTAKSIANARRVIARLGLDETFHRGAQPRGGRRVNKTPSAARVARRGSARTGGRD